jgi:hypothetical protein
MARSRTTRAKNARIESYSGQIGNDALLSRLLGPVSSMLAGRLPGTFVLAVDVGEAVKARLPCGAAQDEIVRFALEAAPGMREGEVCRLQPPLLPFKIQLKCRHRRGSRLGVRCVVLGDGPALRLERVRRAFDAKCPKLAAWAGDAAPLQHRHRARDGRCADPRGRLSRKPADSGRKLKGPVEGHSAGRGAKSLSGLRGMAPQVGFEPTTLRLTAGCSTLELLRNGWRPTGEF